MLSPQLYRRAIPAGARVSRWQAPDGWALRRFDWPSDGGRGGLLFQTGRGDVFEKYLETLAYWHGQGWSVTAVDWRGQGGSGRLCADPLVGHCDAFEPWLDDLAAFWTGWAAQVEGPRVLVGHSMGGHLTLRALAEGRVAADAAVLVAPMLGLRSPVGNWAGERVARLMARTGDPARAAWDSNEIPTARTSRMALLTHDQARYDDELWWYAAKPELRLGPPSWRWLAEAFASTRLLARDPRLAEMRTPLLMLLAEADRLVDPRAALRIAARLPDVQVVRFGKEARHEILREADAVRGPALDAIDRFLQVRAPARQVA
ncbi:alpha/beta fold hydrolase [Sphingomonas aracearum]|uniref:Alpha/beta hydrolase n=1 Tax=Sphingomonas aracearum TaxID=2283317 RepID=A0A369VYH9_9SPHN|nr:alpha/beta hydrolase [Sphingomonas aracearum]